MYAEIEYDPQELSHRWPTFAVRGIAAIVFGFVSTQNAAGVHGNPEEAEDILTVVLSADDFIERVRRGQITDLKTLVAGYWFLV